jgi:Leu/Phe-tRNA-protein transferase
MGFVYLLECSNDDHTVHKIGFTKSTTQKRIKNLQTGNSYEIKELCRYETKFDQKLEKIIHRCYSHRKIKNEWFNLEITDVTNFISNCERVEKNLEALKDNHFFNK